MISYDELNSAEAPDIIFSNLEQPSDNRFNSESSFPIAGRDAIGPTESSSAILIIPKEDVQAKVLLVALGYVSGTKLVNVGLYSDTEVTHTVGDPLPGGQGVITQMPDDGDCCQLAKVTLPNDGVLLSAGVHYWLALTPDDENAPTFHGEWRLSNRAAHASLEPPDQWDASPGQWPAAQIRGTKVQTAEASNVTSVENLSRKRATRAGNITILGSGTI